MNWRRAADPTQRRIDVFIELTKSSTGSRTKICVNSDHIQIIVNDSGCQIGISGFESFIEVAESYDYVVDRLTPLSETAPDMLEALEAVIDYGNGKAMPPSAWKMVQDAIAKAKGES